ncbi:MULTISPECIES: sulfite exporter TauE/SafE family protein [unclassified Oleiphilus]|uniref:sulfite exporter TauE/SafE family protein n=1 Tax=unclassified Oleiphilus TaxID=2631174 RepID=UPI0018D2DC9F|nr:MULTISPECIES: sulfite exporter TauE/SafE family protein [unclassified Oleiphilus]
MLGLLGSGHCFGMCGGLASALGLNTPQHNYVYSYNLGRLSSYTFAGLLVGALGFWFSEYLGALMLLRIAAAIMLILMGLYLTGWLNALLFTEKLGAILWQKLRPIGSRFLRPQSHRAAIALGAVWGWLPCGLVYSGLIYASTQGTLSGSAMTMLAFGLGTLPSMLGVSVAGQRLSAILNSQWFRKSAGMTLICFGAWSLVSSF